MTLLAVLCLAIFAASASAKTHTFTVKTHSDAVHGSCTAKCSLRDAVIAADKAGGTSIIKLPAGTYKLTIPIKITVSDPTDAPAFGDLDINSGVHVTIDGAGPSKTIINGGDQDRLFAVHSGASLTVDGVTAENGDETGADPSALEISEGNGGAFYNDGTLAINKSVLSHDQSYDYGGAIYADTGAKSTSVTNSTMVSNVNDKEDGGVIAVLGGKLTLSGDTSDNNFAYDDGGVVYAHDTSAPVTITGSKFLYNSADDPGGAIYLDGTERVSIAKSSFSNNVADDNGGAVSITGAPSTSVSKTTFSGNGSDGNGAGLSFDDNGPTTVSHSTFTRNAADDSDGGAIYSEDSDRLTVTSSSFTANAADEGAGIATDSADLTVKSSHFTNNNGEEGGALYIEGESGTTGQYVTDSTFTGNQAPDDQGGAIYDDYGDLQVSASSFYRNISDYEGGAIYYDSGDGLSLVNDTLDSNSSYTGGGLYLDGAPATGSVVLRNDTIARNIAYFGGGIGAPYYANVIENTIVADNVGSGGTSGGATTGNGDCFYTFDFNGGTADSGHNLDSDGSCIHGTTAHGDKTANPKLGPLKNNGGPVPTDALLPGSPAIGHGTSCPATDARGDKRKGACDIGAYQVEPKKKKK